MSDTADTPTGDAGQVPTSPTIPSGQAEGAPNIPQSGQVDAKNQGTPVATDSYEVNDDIVRGHKAYKELQAHSTKATQANAELRKQVEELNQYRAALQDPMRYLSKDQIDQYFLGKGYRLVARDDQDYPYNDQTEVMRHNELHNQKIAMLEHQLRSMQQQQYSSTVKNVMSELNEVFGPERWMPYQEEIMRTLEANPGWGADREGIEKLYYSNVPRSVWEGDMYKKFQDQNTSRKELADPTPTQAPPKPDAPDTQIGNSIKDHWRYHMEKITGKKSEV